jgi:hypothetical protein
VVRAGTPRPPGLQIKDGVVRCLKLQQNRGGRLCAGAKVDELAQHLSAFEFDIAFVYVVKPDVARNQVIEFKTALFPGVQQARHVDPKAVAAHRGTLNLPFAQEVVTMQFNLHTNGTIPMIVAVPPARRHWKLCSAVFFRPTASNENSTPPLGSSLIASTGDLSRLAPAAAQRAS